MIIIIIIIIINYYLIFHLSNNMYQIIDGLSDLGFAAWVHRKETTLISFIYIEFLANSLDINVFTESLNKVVATNQIFSKRISQEGLLENRDDGSFSISFEIQESKEIGGNYRDEVLKGNITSLYDEFLSVKLQANGQGDVIIRFIADMAVIDPAWLFAFITDLAYTYGLRLNQLSNLDKTALMTGIEVKPQKGVASISSMTHVEIPGLLWRFNSPGKGKVANFCHQLDAHVYENLKRNAAQHGVLESLAIKTIFCMALTSFSKNKTYRLSLPYFLRRGKIGEPNEYQADFQLQSVCIQREKNIAENASNLSDFNSIVSEIEGGVESLRKLSALSHKTEISPIVYTDLLSCGDLFGGVIKEYFGFPIFCVSRGAGVAIDVQQLILGSKFCSNWDINTELIREEEARDIYDIYLKLLHLYSDSQEVWNMPIDSVLDSINRDREIGRCPEEEFIKLAGRPLSKKYLESLLFELIGQNVQVCQLESGGFVLLVNDDISRKNISNVQSLIAKNYLGQLSFSEIFFVSQAIFDSYLGLSKIQSKDLYLLHSSQGKDDNCLFNNVIYVFLEIASKLLGQMQLKLNAADIDFFSLGGNSLLGTQFVIEINRYYVFADVSIADLFRLRTIYKLAEYVYSQNPQEADRISRIVLDLLARKFKKYE